MPPISPGELPLWRGIDELGDDVDFPNSLERHFPRHASIWASLDTETSRREFLKLMGASIALAGASACTKLPAEKIYPYPLAGQNLSGSQRLLFASSSTFLGYAKGILVESHQGRPTKIEGNSLHPASLGTSDIFMQAEILGLYDPSRSKAVIHEGEVSSWDAFKKAIAASTAGLRNSKLGLRILTNTITSPSMIQQIRSVLAQFPEAKWHSYDVINSDTISSGLEDACGEILRPIYNFNKARVVLSLDADFLGPGTAQQAYARSFIDQRKIKNEKAIEYNRLYTIESSPSLTGCLADSRLALKPSEIAGFALALALKLGIVIDEKAPSWTKRYRHEIDHYAADLLKHAGQCIVIAGDQQAPIVHSLCFAINEHLKNQHKTVDYIQPPDANSIPHMASLKELANDLADNNVEVLLILGANPAYATPARLEFSKLITKAKQTIHLGLFQDETAFLCDWHLPESHFLESFGDARAYDGTLSFQQPLISPLYDSHSASEVLSLFLGDNLKSSYEILKEYWAAHSLSETDFEKALHDGVILETKAKPVAAILQKHWYAKINEGHDETGLEICFRPDPTVFDGRYSNNAWLQELPKPILQLCWDNAALISPKTAERLKLSDEDKVELSLKDRRVAAPVLIVPGHPDDSVTVYFGYGRTRSGIADDRGYNAYELYSGESYYAFGLAIRKLNEKWALARTHRHHNMEGRNIVRRGSIQEFEKNPQSIVMNGAKPLPSLLPKRENADHAWAMVIDLNSCIGCNTCTIACQAENNIPVVGKEQVQNSREMHWIRVDRYYEGEKENPRTFFQPVPCMHCEKAPCELVCPTAATNHSSEGLNQMVYNRCVGTRYCSNNCPYKVRRFNFLQYANTKDAPLRLMNNPNVTVRSRGVMEKCTYCIQRIERTRIKSKIENSKIKDGEITPACAQACPTEAIIFGDKNDPQSRVASLIKSPLNYSLLHELGAVPRTTYLAKLYDKLDWKKEDHNG